MFRTILLAVDGSKYSEKAVECLGGVAERWPSIAWTILTEAFSRIARDAAMCRRSWTQRPSVSLAAPRHAERKSRSPHLEARSGPPPGMVNTRSSKPWGRSAR
jgi:hypothetical protein